MSRFAPHMPSTHTSPFAPSAPLCGSTPCTPLIEPRSIVESQGQSLWLHRMAVSPAVPRATHLITSLPLFNDPPHFGLYSTSPQRASLQSDAMPFVDVLRSH